MFPNVESWQECGSGNPTDFSEGFKPETYLITTQTRASAEGTTLAAPSSMDVITSPHGHHSNTNLLQRQQQSDSSSKRHPFRPCPLPAVSLFSRCVAPSRPEADQMSATGQSQHQNQQEGNPSLDASLSSIVAFNQSYNTAQLQDPADPNQGNSSTVNQWGKRPAEQPSHDTRTDDLNKRQQLEHPGLTAEETEVHNQLQAHIASTTASYGQRQQAQQQHVYQQRTEGVMHDEDDENEHDYEVDEEEQARQQVAHQQDQMSAMIAAQAANPWLNLMDAHSYALWDANQNLRISSLPILDNLVISLLQLSFLSVLI